jgi:hypothetical protein
MCHTVSVVFEGRNRSLAKILLLPDPLPDRGVSGRLMGNLKQSLIALIQLLRSVRSRSMAVIPDQKGATALSNAEAPWDEFDSQWYLDHNYGKIHPDDRAVISRVGSFFATRAIGRKRHAIDVGSGTNLYPALASLPVAQSITLWEYSASNVRWLEHGVRPYGQLWDPFWEALRESAPMYRRFQRPRAVLPVIAKVEKASVFALPEGLWELGTMFFVAESITGIPAEFELATRNFVTALRPGAPFAAAFIRNSRGYHVRDLRFPAVAVTEHEVKRVLRPYADELTVEHVAPGQAFRDGWDGMVLALGTRNRRPRP